MDGQSLDLIEDLKEGDRVKLEGDAAIDAIDDEDVSGMFRRGDSVLLDDTGTVVSVGEDEIVIGLDDQGVRSRDDEDYVSTQFRLKGETIYSMWELLDEAEEKHTRPADTPVAFLCQISKGDE